MLSYHTCRLMVRFRLNLICLRSLVISRNIIVSCTTQLPRINNWWRKRIYRLAILPLNAWMYIPYLLQEISCLINRCWNPRDICYYLVRSAPTFMYHNMNSCWIKHSCENSILAHSVVLNKMSICYASRHIDYVG